MFSLKCHAAVSFIFILIKRNFWFMIVKIVLTDSESNPNVLIYLIRLHGIPRNPYNVNHYTGGSSSGSAVAVAAGIPTSEIKNLFMFSVRI